MKITDRQVIAAYWDYRRRVELLGANSTLGNAIGWLGVIATVYGTRFDFVSVRRSPSEQAELVRQGVGVENSTHLTGDAADLSFRDAQERDIFGQWWNYFGLTWGGDFRRPEPWHFDDRKKTVDTA